MVPGPKETYENIAEPIMTAPIYTYMHTNVYVVYVRRTRIAANSVPAPIKREGSTVRP